MACTIRFRELQQGVIGKLGTAALSRGEMRHGGAVGVRWRDLLAFGPWCRKPFGLRSRKKRGAHVDSIKMYFPEPQLRL